MPLDSGSYSAQGEEYNYFAAICARSTVLAVMIDVNPKDFYDSWHINIPYNQLHGPALLSRLLRTPWLILRKIRRVLLPPAAGRFQASLLNHGSHGRQELRSGFWLLLGWYLSSVSTGRNYPIGITPGVAHTYLLISDLNIEHNFGIPKKTQPAVSPAQSANSSAAPAAVQPKPTEPPKKVIIWWAILIDFGLVLGAFVSGKMSGQAKLLPSRRSRP
jgi:hypothetical protein